jgi:ferritin-like metal-binding protein YciE
MPEPEKHNYTEEDYIGLIKDAVSMEPGAYKRFDAVNKAIRRNQLPRSLDAKLDKTIKEMIKTGEIIENQQGRLYPARTPHN